jgi:putative ABC transport system permease protein
VFNVRLSFAAAADEVIGSLLSNVNITLSRAQRVDAVTRILLAIPEIDRVEGWLSASGQMLMPDGQSATDLAITAPPGGSELIRPVLTEGRWLGPEDQNALVVSNLLLRGRPDVKVGQNVTVKVAGKEHTWLVVGVVKLGGTFLASPVYANYDYLAARLGQHGRASEFRVRTRSQDGAVEAAAAQEARSSLLREGIRVADTITGAKIRADNSQSFDVVILFLLIMSMLIAAVGGLGLMGTMSINVIERTREIGVMRALGASTGAIARIVVTESVLIGALSWLIGSLLAFPISYVMCYAVGLAFLAVPMALIPSALGFAIWLGLVTVIAALASILPSANASRITVREALAYE